MISFSSASLSSDWSSVLILIPPLFVAVSIFSSCWWIWASFREVKLRVWGMPLLTTKGCSLTFFVMAGGFMFLSVQSFIMINILICLTTMNRICMRLSPLSIRSFRVLTAPRVFF